MKVIQQEDVKSSKKVRQIITANENRNSLETTIKALKILNC